MKRSIVLLSLLLLCSLMGCALKEPPQEITEGTEEITTDLVSASADAASADADTVSADADAASADAVNVRAVTAEQEEQLTILAKNRKQWLSHYTSEDGDGGDYDSIHYSVTDLNQNGQLEIVTATCEGSGRFTYYYVNEVTKDGTVKEWKFIGEKDGFMSHADIIIDRMPVYYNEEEGTYTYLCSDYGAGFGGVGCDAESILINGKTIEEKSLGYGWVEYFDEERVKYLNEDSKEITRKEYHRLAKKATPQGIKGNVYFDWECKSLEELLALSEQEVKNELTELSQGFLIRLEQKSNENYNKQIQYLAAHKKEWMKRFTETLHRDDEKISTDYTLIIMDLDQDGCVELGIQHGGDEMLVLEVSEDGGSLEEWNVVGETPYFPSVDAYRSSKDDSVHFVSEDYLSSDESILHETILYESILEDNHLTTKKLFSVIEEEDEDDNLVPANYYNREGREITEQEYHELEVAFYKDLTPIKLYIQDIYPDGPKPDFEELDKLTDEELTDMLQEGMECFYIG